MGQGLAASLQRPGGNLTGIRNQLEVLTAKRYQLLRELAPQLARETVVYHPDNPVSAGSVDEQTRVAAAVGITAFPVGRMHLLRPCVRIELLIRTMLPSTWAPEAWPVVKHELVKAMELRRQLARGGWFN